MVEYEELRIRYFNTGTDRYLVFANGSAAAAGVMALKKAPAVYRQELQDLLREAFEGQSNASRRRASAAFRQLGRELFEVVLPSPVDQCLRDSLAWAQEQGRYLRIRFEISPDTPELMDIPFELICSPAVDPLGVAALRPMLSLVRSLKGLTLSAQRIPRAEDKRGWFPVLAVAPTPADRKPLSVRREIEKIRAAAPALMREVDLHLLGGPDPGVPRPTQIQLNHLLTVQEDRPCAVLLIAHGEYRQGEIVVALETESGQPDLISAQLLADLLIRAKGLRLVVLNLCLGTQGVSGEPFSGLAQALIGGGIPAVVAMQAEVSDAAAVQISPSLLGSLWNNETVDEAVWSARQTVAPGSRTQIEWCNPVLFLHRECNQGWLFKVPALVDGKNAAPDALADEDSVLERLNAAMPNLDDVALGAHILRGRREWDQVARYANLLSIRRRNLAAQYIRLSLEAKAELQIEDFASLCRRLALAEDVPSSGADIGTLKKSLPQEVFQILSTEIDQAAEALQSYREAVASASRGKWQRAIERYKRTLELRPGGYKDAREQLEAAQLELTLATQYEKAETELKAGKWRQARDTYQGLETRPAGYLQAASGKLYAEGRCAEEQENWTAARQAYSSLSAGLPKAKKTYLDVKDREIYARGREAEKDKKWQEAARAYSKLKFAAFPDLKERLPYCQACAVEQAGRWSEAYEAFAALDNGSLDVQQRKDYVRGRAAEAAGDWQGALGAFGTLPLPDDYRDGDVGRRRGFARAKLAEAEESWAQVVEALKDVPGDFHDGESATLRSYAEGRQAEGGEDWERAEAAYERVGGYRDAQARTVYARGRKAEEQERWSDAASAFASLPGPIREDVAPRRSYAEGRAAEEQGLWSQAAAAYQPLAADFRDRGQRLPYAMAREAEQKGDWASVVAAASPLPADYRDSGRLADYARGRLAEEREDWRAAAASSERCSGYADAGERRGYAVGRCHEDAGDWSQALAEWAPLPPELRDVAARCERLRQLLRVLPWADGVVGAGLVADPFAASMGLIPYSALREAGIHPGSPAEAINDASFALMEKGAMTPEARRAWDHLRSPEGRLRVDAFLYRLEDLEGLRRFLAQAAAGSPAELLAAADEALPGDAPLFALLDQDDHRRDKAIAGWEALLARDPARTAAAHALALVHYFRARELEASGAYEQAESAWEKAIAGWGVVLSDDAYWDVWRRERAVRYQQAVTAADVARLRSDLGQQMLDHLTNCAERCAVDGHTAREERYRALALDLEAELEGARLLKEVGGLALEEGAGRPLVCGPLFLRGLALGPRLGRKIIELEAPGDRGEREDILTALDAALGRVELTGEPPGTAPGTLFGLRCAFSELGRALLLLQGHQPELALRALPPTYRARPVDLPADCAAPATEEAHVPSCPACQAFARSNPAYLLLTHRSVRLLQDAVELAIRAHLGMAQTALTAGGDRLDEAFQSWEEAIKVSRNAGSQVRTKRAIVRVVLGRAKALAQDRGPRRGERLTAAIALVEQARSLIGGADEGQLAALAAKLLTDRGVWFGYGCHDWEDPDYEKAAADLRRALELTPDALHARDNLSRALIFQAANLQGEKAGQGPPLRLLAEAIAVLHEGLCRTAGHQQLTEMMRRGLDELEECILHDLSEEEIRKRMETTEGSRPAAGESNAEKAQQLAATAARRRAQGDETGELMALITAVRLDTGDDVMRRSLLTAVQRRAGLES